ncbi:MAG: protein-L-isoaspartate O-methyltransferase [Candidatus Edwardsbacteria bacterium RIFOXYD12_FULL_50_11]|jgi:protein-L-isoaspartate(D-aspartate) O-methyltransferase|uniref:Protein-L-isoaspartate O-methyltransferase n=1 Tax=Candidatus Edwardsbacteria bacterium GWF2_54_11 TaxID=1817851 RepID=A0A1F5RG59_9BACT|nr:MAG: protein-L-isoaspartate O-methyltransferase [Candidatus Edwardsbacteria bacterium RifOxyC12_full_54_24]OGF08513.1 MAG: protein-L-isoaspartate O-methyltransferase [Candidatus Edwardsbacteria bacterium RifOxyA12_full_54_48]OGF11423.1 MAG: protein-L-isoaspartate O-methyltransferase [Candidatus Edwardsbacteria bacterium GWE2_54_12]OGF13358.1 MAG: protein-L-isoaspartate O-methyltransferase [Candidatus Edwardsbacteria bacterium GWF2_54_11]OGF16399.1 MAG: protein-L-isoaspartate O-methyltransfer
MNYELSRKQMVDQQIIRRGVNDPRVIAAMQKVPRHLFVQEALQYRGYDDNPLPIGQAQTISQPYIVALMSQNLNIKGGEKVLEIGTGSGYQAAVLAEMGAKVFTIERVEKLYHNSRKLLEDLKYHDIAVKLGDGTIGWAEHAPYDRIIVTAGAPEVPKAYWDQLAEGGRIAIPVGDVHVQSLVLVDKIEGKEVKSQVCGCVFVPLIGKYGWQTNGQ